ncbi:AIPR family protein [Paenibacillus taichungensis]
MLLPKFYELIDSELTEIIHANTDDALLKKFKQENQKKGYAFLIWFLMFYGQSLTIKEFITDGDGDSSCDIILSKTDVFGKTIFYIVQSKWNTKNNCEKMINATELKQSLNDFETILRGDKKKTSNERFNRKYAELLTHLENNGEVKFIFLSLCLNNPECSDNLQSFQRAYGPNITAEIFDITKIRSDYIETKFKGLSSLSPLAFNYNPEESNIILPIERFANKHDRDFIDFKNGTSRAYIFIIKPKTVYELFEKYGLGLFFKNVRNPLILSDYNKGIKETIEKRPGSFWYFNNGITAITKLIPEVGIQAKQVEITGLQIINGAQTVYSIYLAYKEANGVQRQIMDTDARITLRLIRSSDESFNLSITRFTNSQNEVTPNDFMANDEVQIRLQNESFNTPVWYRRRRGEFVELNRPSSIHIVNNFEFALAYVAFHLQDPYSAMEKSSLFFISHIDNSNGLYEKIFNKATKFEDMLASYYLYILLSDQYSIGNDKDAQKMGITKATHAVVVSVLSLSKVYFDLFLTIKYGNEKKINISRYINKSIEEEDEEKLNVIRNIIELCNKKLVEGSELGEFGDIFSKLLDSNNYFIRITDQLRETGLDQETLAYIERVVDDEVGQEIAVSSERVVE